ncbi:MAG: hypothetical protein QXR85_01140 [Candidatus Micrarchaeaceae archaeon]
MITGLTVSSVSANRPTNESITNMKFNINFDDVKVDNGNVEVLYTFTADYQGGENNSKSVGDLKIAGKISAKEDKKKSDEISKTWLDKKTLPIDFAEDLINLLNFECGSRGTLLAWSIGLIAPLPLSRAKLQEQQKPAT